MTPVSHKIFGVPGPRENSTVHINLAHVVAIGLAVPRSLYSPQGKNFCIQIKFLSTTHASGFEPMGHFKDLGEAEAKLRELVGHMSSTVDHPHYS